jgi:hypothetical protein
VSPSPWPRPAPIRPQFLTQLLPNLLPSRKREILTPLLAQWLRQAVGGRLIRWSRVRVPPRSFLPSAATGRQAELPFFRFDFFLAADDGRFFAGAGWLMTVASRSARRLPASHGQAASSAISAKLS